MRYEAYRYEWDRRGEELDGADHPAHVDLEPSPFAICAAEAAKRILWAARSGPTHIRKLGFDEHTYKRG